MIRVPAILLLVAATVLAQEESKPPAPVECLPSEVTLHEGTTSQVTCKPKVSAGKESAVLLPSAAAPESILIVDGGKTVTSFRYQRDVMVSEAPAQGSPAKSGDEAPAPKKRNVLKWTSVKTEQREVTVSFLAKGLGWQPSYRAAVDAAGKVTLSLSAVVTNADVVLSDVSVRLLYSPPSPREGAASPAPKGPRAQAASLAAEYWEPEAQDVPLAPTYDIAVEGKQDIATSGVTVLALWQDVETPAETLVCWVASGDAAPASVWRIGNPKDKPLPGGRIEVYRQGAFLGEDEIRFTPPGRHACVCVSDAGEVSTQKKLVFAEAKPLDEAHRDYKWHEHFVLTAKNLGAKDAHVLVLDASYRDPLNLVRKPEPDHEDGTWQVWKLTLPAGQAKEISEEFYSYHLYNR